jgi:hypothetical protein
MSYRRNLIKKAVRQRFVIMGTTEGPFSGVLVEYDHTHWIFENCKTVPTRNDQPSEELPGRVWVKHACNPPPLLQEITADARETLGREI